MTIEEKVKLIVEQCGLQDTKLVENIVLIVEQTAAEAVTAREAELKQETEQLAESIKTQVEQLAEHAAERIKEIKAEQLTESELVEAKVKHEMQIFTENFKTELATQEEFNSMKTLVESLRNTFEGIGWSDNAVQLQERYDDLALRYNKVLSESQEKQAADILEEKLKGVSDMSKDKVRAIAQNLDKSNPEKFGQLVESLISDAKAEATKGTTLLTESQKPTLLTESQKPTLSPEMQLYLKAI